MNSLCSPEWLCHGPRNSEKLENLDCLSEPKHQNQTHGKGLTLVLMWAWGFLQLKRASTPRQTRFCTHTRDLQTHKVAVIDIRFRQAEPFFNATQRGSSMNEMTIHRAQGERNSQTNNPGTGTPLLLKHKVRCPHSHTRTHTHALHVYTHTQYILPQIVCSLTLAARPGFIHQPLLLSLKCPNFSRREGSRDGGREGQRE